MKAEHKAIATRFATKVCKLKGVKEIYLHGSSVTGKTHPKSDIDILIYGENVDRQAVADLVDDNRLNVFFCEPLHVRLKRRAADVVLGKYPSIKLFSNTFNTAEVPQTETK